MSLFDLIGGLGGVGGGPLGEIAGIGGAVMGFMGQQEAMKGAEAAALQSSIQAGLNQKMLVNKATLAARVFQRQQLQQVRNAQMARAQAKAAGVNQGAQYGSALPGAYGGISGSEVSNLQAQGNQFQTFQANFGLEQQDYQSKLLQTQDQQQIMQGQGLMQEGNMITGFGKAAGQLLPSFGTMFGQVNAGISNAAYNMDPSNSAFG
jgi:hypothetical protein